ncbi:MAG TPA: hypothetical protein VGY66_08890 [Gemmataceae bacterium]|nr:hypothetical protein [Gemmataceae bacterium]
MGLDSFVLVATFLNRRFECMMRIRGNLTMPLTITVKDPLASELQSKAEMRKIPVEQFALEVLGQAVKRYDWPATNRRRLALIQKQFAEGLTPAEAAEVQDLQRQADQTLEALDAPMLEGIAQMEQMAAKALDDSSQ